MLKYIIGLCNQLDFNRSHFRLTIFGDTSPHQLDIEWVSKYFKNINFTTPSPNIQYQEGVEKFQKPELFESYWELP